MYKLITLCAITGFISIVVYLHLVQIGYNPFYQLMSELALGEQGSLMLAAFFCFALAVASVSQILNHIVLKLLLGLAALALVAAGVFELGTATVVHVALVAIAFVLLVLAMYLTPRLLLTQPNITWLCWTLGASTALFIALGHSLLAIGLAQRLATACILLWLAWLVFLQD